MYSSKRFITSVSSSIESLILFMGVLGCEGNIAAAGTTLLPMEKIKFLVFMLVIEKNSVLLAISSEKGLYGIRAVPLRFDQIKGNVSI